MSTTQESTDSGTGGSRIRRPVWVWVICIYIFLSVGFYILSFALTLSGAVPLTPAQQAYFPGLGVVNYGSIIGLALLNLTAMAFLFVLRKIAVTLFGASLLLNVGFTLVHAATTTWEQAIGWSGLVGVLIGWGILAAVFLYARHLRQTGVLR